MEEPSKDPLTLSPGCKMEDEDITADCAGEETMSSAMEGGPHSVERPWNPSDSERPRPAGDGAGIQGENTFSCPECGESFISELSLAEHQRSHTGEKFHSCSECGKSFLHKSKLVVHYRSHTGEKPYSCPECGKSFSQKTKLNRHLKVHTGEKPYACPKCGKSFARKEDLFRHEKTHTGEKPYCCPECGKGFPQKTKLNRHLKLHMGEKPYACSKCWKWFSRKSDLFRHQRTHIGDKLYSCPECGRGFSHRTKLNRHLMLHTGAKPYACAKCGKSFARKSDLFRHERTHTGKKPHSCQECGKRFSRKHDLFRHQRFHTGEKSYYCSECGKGFSQMSHLNTHQMSHTGVKPNSGPECEKSSSRKSHPSEHEIRHTLEMLFSCPECGKCSATSSDFCAYRRSHTGKTPYSCSECGKGFSEKSHLNSHQKCHAAENPYSYAESEICFSQNSNLTNQEIYHPGEETSLTPRASSKMSAVWLYYTVNERNARIADCKLCSAKISRGGSRVSDFNTTNLIKHLKVKHRSQHAEFTAVSIRNTLRPPAPAKRTMLSREDPKAIRITEAVAQFIILDDQPISALGDVGFRRLLDVLEPKYEIPSQGYVTSVVLPHMRDAVKKHVACMLQGGDIKAMSFTADLWRGGASPTSVASLTAQWLDDGFALRQVMLHAEKFQGSQAASTARILEETLETWAIPRSSVHAVVRDRAAEDAGLPSIPCVAHTLQLAVSEGLLSQRSVAQAVAVGRRVVGHFEHSNLEYSWLQDIQLQLGQPVKRLQPDVECRWDSTFHMLRSLIEQKRAIGGYESQHELPVAITGNVWNLMEKTLNILAPLEELARQLSSSEALASDVIPAVTVLQKMLSKEVNEERGTKSMKSALLAAFQKHFSDVERNPLYCLATLLDPRYKDRFFSRGDTGRQAKEMLRLELEKVSAEAAAAEALEEAAMRSGDGVRAGTSLESVYHEIAAESISESRAPNAAVIQLEVYLGEATAPRSDKPLRYWAVHKLQFPALAQVAQKYLSAPCSRLSSTAPHPPADSGNRLLGEHAEILMFLKKNLPLTFQK